MWWKRQRSDPPEPPVDPKEVSDPVFYRLDTTDPEIADRPRTLVTALGNGGSQVSAMILSACNIARQNGRYPIVVCTDMPTRFLVDSTTPVELLPRAQDLPNLSLAEFSQYLAKRWEILCGKWGITEIVDLADEFEEYLTAQTRVVASTETQIPTEEGSLS